MAKRSGRTASWVTFDDHGQTTGPGQVSYSVEQHNGRQQRGEVRSHITGNSGDDCIVKIYQNGRPLYVEFVGSPYSVGNGAGYVWIHGKTNAKTLSFAIGSGTFITLDPDGYMEYENGSSTGSYISFGASPTGDPGASDEWEFCLKVTYTANETTSQRSATVVVTATGEGTDTATATATINQAGGVGFVQIKKSTDSTWGTEVTLTFAWNETTAQDVLVNSNEPWEVSID